MKLERDENHICKFVSQIFVKTYFLYFIFIIASLWITPARFKEHEYHSFRQNWYTRNVLVFTSTGTFQYLGPEVYFSVNSDSQKEEGGKNKIK